MGDLISIIVPVYRSEKTLKRCITSLWDQTHKNIDIIMIVDENDSCAVLADQLASQSNNTRIIYQPNLGVSASRNRGIAEAKGEFIMFVDSDDYADKEMCELMIDGIFDNHSDMVISGYHHMYFNRDVERNLELRETFLLTKNEPFFNALFQLDLINVPWNKIYKKKLIKDLFPCDRSLGEDLLFNLKYMEHINCISIIPEMLYYYVQDNRGTTLSTKRRDDKIPNILFLYENLRQFKSKMFNRDEATGLLETKVLEEFLNDILLLYLYKDLSKKQKKEMILKYKEAWDTFPCKEKTWRNYIDHKIIYYFFKKGNVSMILFLVRIRGMVMKIIRRQ